MAGPGDSLAGAGQRRSAVPALECVGADALRPQVLEAIATLRDDNGIYRFRNDQQFVVARKG
ncbi:MAG: hypothetical protein R2714_07435 [Microthrixaceae bacterium]